MVGRQRGREWLGSRGRGRGGSAGERRGSWRDGVTGKPSVEISQPVRLVPNQLLTSPAWRVGGASGRHMTIKPA